MIPSLNIVAWSRHAPWAEPRQVEQDLIISRAVIEIFSDPFLNTELRFRGGTALNKLHFPVPLRYSEDIDLVRTTAGPIGPILDQVRVVLEPWLGNGQFDQSPVAPKLKFRVSAEDQPDVPIRLKVEINTSEIEAYDAPICIPLKVDNPWFNGAVDVPTFSPEEMLATKLRALLQRDKGRDLYDLAHAIDVFENLDSDRVAQCLKKYLDKSGQQISRAEADERMFAKLSRAMFLEDITALLPADQAATIDERSTRFAFENVFKHLISHMDGAPWVRSAEMAERFGISIER